MFATLKARHALLDALRRKTIWTAPGVGTAIVEIDACLRGGLTLGALHEIAAADFRAIPGA